MSRPRKHSPPFTRAFSPEEAAARDALDALDRKARDVEQAYGYAESILVRLPPEEAARFKRAMFKLDQAIENSEHERIPALAGALARGWDHITTLIDPLNHEPIATWRTTIDARRYLVVRDNVDIEAGLLKAEKGEVVVSLEELIRVYVNRQERFLDFKQQFPGAHVVEAGKPKPDWAKGDEVPF